MSSEHKVAIIVGSLRKGSFSRKIAQSLVELAPASLKFSFVEIGGLSFYNQDLDGTPPADWEAFRAQIAAAHAVLFVTPEYNRSVPGVLKNAIDIGSRPWGKGALLGKPAAVISTSIGAIGGFGANHHLRQTLAFLNMPTLGQPEAYVGGTGGLYDDSGALTSDATRDFLANFASTFASFITHQLKA